MGGHIGYRRTVTGGTWVVRYRLKNGKGLYESFGELDGVDPVEQFDYTQKNALEWIASLGVVSDGGYTVKNAIEGYVEQLKIHNSIKVASKTQSRLNYHI